MSRVRRMLGALAALALLAAVASGCSSGGSQHFSADGVAFSFDYPAGWTLSRTPSAAPDAGAAIETVTVALKEPYDQVTTSQYKLKKTIPEGERAYKLEVDRIVSRLARTSGGSVDDGDEVEFGGLAGYQYTLKYTVDKVKLENKLTLLFLGDQQFVIACQSAPERRKQLNAGCEQVLDSIDFGSSPAD